MRVSFYTLAIALVAAWPAACSRHYIQLTETYKDKLMLTTIKETRVLWIPISVRQTINACTMPDDTTLKCEEVIPTYNSLLPL